MPFAIRRVHVAWLAVIVALVVIGLFLVPRATGQTQKAGARSIRVMSYNIGHGAGTDGVFDLARIAAAIKVEHPSVVALQAVDMHWSDRSDFVDETNALAHHLGFRYYYFAPIYNEPPLTAGAPDRQYGVAFLSHYKIVDNHNHWITRVSTETVDAAPASAPGFGEIAIRVGNTPVHIYTTDLDERPGTTTRAVQIADMLRYLDQDKAAKILTGSFHIRPNSNTLYPLYASFSDVWTQVGDPNPPTYPAAAPVAAVDYILVSSPLHAGYAEVGETVASDHRPVVADIALGQS